MDRNEAIGIIIAVVVVILSICVPIYLISWSVAGIGLGETYTTVGTIELYEQSSWCGEHTWVVLQTLGGTQASFKLVGYHDFVLGNDYEIRTVAERGGLWGLSNWYRVTEIEELTV